ncbi:MAG: 2Fe-2S iron-sulfur cluster-binding protein [Myxococcota bacterium]|nr:2Fe-2S iron-sulfur cluster-binding protein [Myxococcota bacterium]
MAKVIFKKNRLMKNDIVVDIEPGETLLHLAEDHGIPIGSNCGGVCGCSTCHVYVTQGFESLEEMSDREADRLDLGFDVRLNSRLSCQAELSDQELVVEITEESLQAFLDENPKIRKKFEQTGELDLIPRHHH